MDEALRRLRLDYTPIMLRYLTEQDESGRQSAYELGRNAMRESVGLLAMVRVHNEVFLDVHASARSLDEAQDVARAAAVLLSELIASFEMTQRGYVENREPRGAT